MGKDSNKNLVGQPIFKQIIKMIPGERLDTLAYQLQKRLGIIRYFFLGISY